MEERKKTVRNELLNFSIKQATNPQIKMFIEQNLRLSDADYIQAMTGVYHTLFAECEISTQLIIFDIFMKKPELVIQHFKKLLIEEDLYCNKHFPQHYSAESVIMNNKKQVVFNTIATLPRLLEHMPSKNIYKIIPIFEHLIVTSNQIIKFMEEEINPNIPEPFKSFVAKKKNQEFKEKYNREFDEDKILDTKKKQIKSLSFFSNSLNEIVNLDYNSHSINDDVLYFMTKLIYTNDLSFSLESFPMDYLIKAIQSNKTNRTDSYFNLLLEKIVESSLENIFSGKFILTDLFDILYSNNHFSMLSIMLRKIFIAVKPNDDTQFDKQVSVQDLSLYLNELTNLIIDYNSIEISKQLQSYVSILTSAICERKQDEQYIQNDANELCAFNILSQNLKSIIERVKMEDLHQLFPIIIVMNNEFSKLITEKYLKENYKDEKKEQVLSKQPDENEFLNFAFNVIILFIRKPLEDGLGYKKYLSEEQANRFMKNYTTFNTKYNTNKLAQQFTFENRGSLLDFVSLYLSSNIHNKDKLIVQKAEIISNFVHTLNTKFRAYGNAKRVEEVRLNEQKEMLSFLTHTLRNTLSAGPQIAKSITGNLKFLLGDSYLENNTAYKTINNATSLLTTFKYVDNLIETFKLFSTDKSTITKKWENETDGDLLIGDLVNQILIQTISKFLFYDSYLDERKQLFDSDNIKPIKESFLEQVLVNTENGNQAENVLAWLNNNNTTIQASPITSEFKIKNNGIRFGILFSIFSELISNSFSYFDGIGEIEIDLNENEQFIEFICRNHYDVNLNISKGTNKGIFFIKHIIGLVEELSLDVSQQNGVWISKIRIKK